MSQYEWDVYANGSEEDVLHSLLQEEIGNQDRRGRTGSKAVAKHRLVYTVVFAVVMILWTVMPTAVKPWALPVSLLVGGGYYVIANGNSKNKNAGCGCLPIMVVLPFALMFAMSAKSSANGIVTAIGMLIGTVFYILLMRGEHKRGRIVHLASLAKADPTKDLAQLVAEDSYVIGEEKPLGSSNALIAVILAAAVAGSGLGIRAGYSETITADDDIELANSNPQAAYTWEKGKNGYILTDFDAGTEERNPNIPAQIDGTPVVAIGERAFQNETRVTDIVIPDSVTEIGSYAFKNCTNLTSITMGDQVTAIGGEAFYGCKSLTGFTVPAGVTEIRGNTFQDCTGLTSVTLHEGITAIHAYAFNNCSSLVSITLPSGITEIRANTFENCTSLTSIDIPEGVTRIAAHAFRGCSALAEVDVPSTVTEIGSSAFRDCDSLKEIYLPMNCVVNERAFKDSPTDVEYSSFTDAQWQAIVAEADAKIVDVLYLVYDKEQGPNVVFYPGEEYRIVIADSEYFTENISVTMALQPMYDYGEVLEYLRMAKEQGAQNVQYCVLSPLASEISGENWFIGVEYTIDEMIAQAESGLAES